MLETCIQYPDKDCRMLLLFKSVNFTPLIQVGDKIAVFLHAVQWEFGPPVLKLDIFVSHLLHALSYKFCLLMFIHYNAGSHNSVLFPYWVYFWDPSTTLLCFPTGFISGILPQLCSVSLLGLFLGYFHNSVQFWTRNFEKVRFFQQLGPNIFALRKRFSLFGTPN